jgi:hypothetical protein
MMAAGRRLAGRDYARRGARCSILRSGDMAVRTTAPAGRCVRAVVTSDGIGGTACFGGTVPLSVTSDGIGGTGGVGETVPFLVTSEGIGGTGGLGGAVPLRDGRGRVLAGPDRGGVWLVRAWCRPLAGGVRRSVAGDRVVSGRPERCGGGRAGGRPLADAQ